MRKVLVLLVCILVGGCQPVTVQRHEEGPVPVTLRVDDAAYWLEEWSRVIMLPDDQLEETLKSREEEFARRRDARSRLRLALLLAEGPEPVRDQLRALSLLQAMDPAGASSSAQALATLLDQVIREHLAAEDKIRTLQQEQAVSAERVQELERQLQEVTDIEQSIQKRETPVDGKE